MLLKTYDSEPGIRRQEITQYSTNKANTLNAIFQTKQQTHNLLENSTLHSSPQDPTILINTENENAPDGTTLTSRVNGYLRHNAGSGPIKDLGKRSSCRGR
ncbi:hypothetical protein Tsp_05074 [Trichinella spiralis]|uniref:hypothetical protein n=1 Tax=Trichinella spiralis TaxID=6334 RepID=UPI0001EFED00|nr:hypothetical protein Tsp_05074 [Trichinella spiralis]